MSYKVYMHKTQSGGVYIGITRQSLKRRWRNGSSYIECRHFYNAIKKYGWDNIEHKLLFDNLTELEAKMIEQDLIYYYKKQGISYNITDGGDGTYGLKCSEDRKQKISKANTGKYVGRKLSDEWKAKIVENHIKRAVVQIDNGTIIMEYPSIKDAAMAVNRDPTSISQACKKGCKSAGYNWQYKED